MEPNYVRAHGMAFPIPAALDQAQRDMTEDELKAALKDRYGNVNPFVLAEIERRGAYHLLNFPKPGITMGEMLAKMIGA